MWWRGGGSWCPCARETGGTDELGVIPAGINDNFENWMVLMAILRIGAY